MLLRQEQKSRRRAAFTLMEMLVVVAIIVALAGIGGFFLMGQMESAKKDLALTQVKGPLTNACMSYSIKHGKFPDNLQVLTEPDEYKVLYIDDPQALIDPWRKPYTYDAGGANQQGRKPDISTMAPDGTLICNWPIKTGQAR
jgi:general secretion pathway protein G